MKYYVQQNIRSRYNKHSYSVSYSHPGRILTNNLYTHFCQRQQLIMMMFRPAVLLVNTGNNPLSYIPWRSDLPLPCKPRRTTPRSWNSGLIFGNWLNNRRIPPYTGFKSIQENSEWSSIGPKASEARDENKNTNYSSQKKQNNLDPQSLITGPTIPHEITPKTRK